MRTRLILGTVLVVVLIPRAASALCTEQPFDDAVRSSDSVLVATVADAAPPGNQVTGIIVRLDVEQVLKGSAEDGQRVWISSCGHAIFGSAAESGAQQMIGTRGLFLLSTSGDGTSLEYSDVGTPHMTLDQEIAEARQVLGLPANPSALDGRGTISSWAWAGVGLLVVAIAGVTLVRRRARRS